MNLKRLHEKAAYFALDDKGFRERIVKDVQEMKDKIEVLSNTIEKITEQIHSVSKKIFFVNAQNSRSFNRIRHDQQSQAPQTPPPPITTQEK